MLKNIELEVEEVALGACVALWRAVVLQAFMDAFIEPKVKKKKFRATGGARGLADCDSARGWFIGDSRDFKFACENAALRPSWVRARYFALKAGCADREQTIARWRHGNIRSRGLHNGKMTRHKVCLTKTCKQ